MFVLFYFIQNFFNYLISDFFRLIQCLNCVLDEMYGHEEEEYESLVIKPLVLYENKYVDKYNNLTSTSSNIDKTMFSHQFIIEMTPIGNVIMQYDVDKEGFVYYSDNMIPFRYLETVARKYVCVYGCKELYIERRVVDAQEDVKKPVKTKDLIQLKRNATKPDVPKIEVEMNRYSNLGRFSNFNMLQKVERHVTDKKRLLTFSEFKRQSVIS